MQGLRSELARKECELDLKEFEMVLTFALYESPYALQKKVSDEGLERYVDFIGAVSHERALQLMNESNVILMPSRFEGFPLVALEAAQIERPLVATHVDGLGEAVLDGETGILIHPEDPVALAGAVISLFDDPDRARHDRLAVNRRVDLDRAEH